MVAMTRQIEAAVQGLLVQVHEKEYEMEVEGDEMKRSLWQREAEKEQAAKMKGWDAERKRERALFNAEMAGDLTEEGEQKLMDKLNAKKEELKSLRKAHDALEREFTQLDEVCSEVRKVTGVNSLAEVVEKKGWVMTISGVIVLVVAVVIIGSIGKRALKRALEDQADTTASS